MKYVLLTLSLAAGLAIAGLPAAGAAGEPAGWYRVQLGGVITGADRAALDAAGARSPLYVPANAYVAWLDAAAVDAVRAVKSVSSVRALGAADKIDAALQGSGRASALVYGGRLDAARTALEAVADVAGVLGTGDSRVREVLLEAADVTAVAAVAEVLYVGPAPRALAPEDEGTAQIQAGQLDGTGTRPVPGYEPWLAGLGLSGEGVKVAVVDTGVDEKHPDLAGRVEKHRDYTPVPEPEDSFGHGTHVGGIVAGNASALRAAGGVKDFAGFYYGLGVAPKAGLVDVNAIGTTVLDWPPPYGFARLTTDVLAAGAGIWNASWHTGEGTGAGYIATARTLDELVRDGNPQTAAAEPFTMVFSAGNAGPNPSTMTSPKEAKNIISVASTASQRAGVSSIDEISSFSSRGPARDGRITPTVAAPGEAVASTRSLPASAVCNEPPTDGNSAGLYGMCSGTSMASPHGAGAAALVTQWWRNRTFGQTPSPALIKALLVNTATDIGPPNIPNGEEGWGRINLGALFEPSIPKLAVDQAELLTEPGRKRIFKVKPADPTKPLRITLAWTDAPGTPQANKALPALVNDLDLVVTGSGTTWRGNNFVRGASVEGGTADRLNNVESVYIQQPGNATHFVEVHAANLPGDGVPAAGDTTDQDFALVVSNAIGDVVPVAPVLGTPYASFGFDAGAEGWTASGIPTWSRSAPGTKTGASDPATQSFGLEGRTNYVNFVDAALTSPPIATQAGPAVIDFWLRIDTEPGWDFVKVEWSDDGHTWRFVDRFSGENPGWAQGEWVRRTVGFESPGGDVRVRFRFTSDSSVSALTHAQYTGARVDEVIVGKQAG